MSTGPTRFAIALTAEVSRASSRATSVTPSLASAARPFSSISVANTLAPSRANAMAQARPMPAAPAVTKARLPLRRSDMFFSLRSLLGRPQRRPCERRDPYAAASRLGYMLEAFYIVEAGGYGSLRSQGRRSRLMIIARHADRAGDVVIARRKLHA